MTFIIPDAAKGTPGATVMFRATLTATTNQYLADKLPVTGLVKIGERDIHGNCIRLLFRPDAEDGSVSTFVMVPNAVFEFASTA